MIKNKFGVFSINGVAFPKTKSMLEELGITVVIKTDNDITKVPKRAEKRYTGLLRCINLLNDDKKDELKYKTGFSSLDKDFFTFPVLEINKSFIEDKLDIIVKFLKEENILVSKHNDGFEGDLCEYLGGQIDSDDIEFLRKKKLLNLHTLIVDGDIDICINESNKNNILVGFCNEL